MTRLVLAVGDADRHGRLCAALDDDAASQVRQGGVAATSAGCDAVLVSFPLAAERYGADPTRHVAQVLVNVRSDGAPDVVVAIPPLEVDAQGVPLDLGLSHRAWVARGLDAALTAYTRETGEHEGTVLLHLEAVGMVAEPLTVVEVARELEAHFAAPPREGGVSR